MRLINCRTSEFEEFYQPDGIRYAILSHRWQNDEVSYQDMCGDRNRVAGKQGFEKVEAFRRLALQRDITHIWVDTCCIDKSSSAELSEAINSMYRWYGQSTVCYAYLYDFRFDPMDNSIDFGNALARSEWFYRGWTLQELIAPDEVLFYDCNWQFFGSKAHMALILRVITRIPASVLTGEVSVEELTIAERMSWANKRNCSRVEDIAYSLLGLFDVNMPLLYGEGPKAFIRLQKEIINQSNDHTIFAWRPANMITAPTSVSPMLASSPLDFDPMWGFGTSARGQRAYTITNNGLAINLSLRPLTPFIYIALLRCLISETRRKETACIVGIYLKKIEGTLFRRVKLLDQVFHLEPKGTFDTKLHNYVDINIDLRQWHIHDEVVPTYALRIEQLKFDTDSSVHNDLSMDMIEFLTAPPASHIASDRIAKIAPGAVGHILTLVIPDKVSKHIRRIKFGIDYNFNLVCAIETTLHQHYSEAEHEFKCSTYTRSNQDDVTTKAISEITCLERNGWDNTSSFSKIGPTDTCVCCLKMQKRWLTFGRVYQKHFLLCYAIGDVYAVKIDLSWEHLDRNEGIVGWSFNLQCHRLRNNQK